MLWRAPTIRALAAAAEEGHVFGCDAELAKLDPIVRFVVRGRVRRLSLRAQSLTSSSDLDHALRIAALLARGREPAAAYDDVEGIAAELANVRATLGASKKSGPWVTIFAVTCLVVLAGAGVVARAILRPFNPRDTPAGLALGHAVPSFLVEVDAATRAGKLGPELDARRAQVLDASARKALGAKPSERADDLLKAIVEVARADDDPKREAASAHFTTAATGLNAALLEGGLPYFVDVDVVMTRKATEPWLYTFYVERELSCEAAGKPERVVHLSRLDDLNLGQHFLGYTRSTTGAAIVLLDQIETELVLQVLPGIPEGELTNIVDETTRAERHAPWVDALENRAAEIVRAHYKSLGDAGIDEVGKLLARRRALVTIWKAKVATQGFRLREPQRLVPEADYHQDLAMRIASSELREWDDIHDRLLEKEPQRAFLRARADRVASIQRHEVEHRADYGRGLVPVPEAIASMLGVKDPLAASPGSLAGRVRDEYSAYLAEIAGGTSPELDLMLLVRFLFDADQRGGTYGITAYAVIQALGKQMEAKTVVTYGNDRVGLTALFVELTTRPPAELKAAARAVWERDFGGPLPEQKELRAVDHTAWRKTR